MAREARNTKQNKLAESWVNTVLTPLIHNLKREQHILGLSYTWRHNDSSFEYLGATKDLVGGYYWPNCEQLFDHYPQFQASSARYDEKYSLLLDACINAFLAAMKDSNFLRLVDQATKGAKDKDEYVYQYFADYLVNGIKELQAHYTYHEMYNASADDFLSLRGIDNELGNTLRSVAESGQEFSRELENFLNDAISLRNNIADSHGIPRVAPTDAS